MAAVEERREVRAEARYVRTAPRKAQLVAEQIRGRTVPEARTILAFMTRDAARDVEKVLSSAVANAEANHGLVGTRANGGGEAEAGDSQDRSDFDGKATEVRRKAKDPATKGKGRGAQGR